MRSMPTFFAVFVPGHEAVVVGRSPGVRPETVALTAVLSELKLDPGGLDAGSGEQGTLSGYAGGLGLFVWTYSSLQPVTFGAAVPFDRRVQGRARCDRPRGCRFRAF